jgi:hypothetical protein
MDQRIWIRIQEDKKIFGGGLEAFLKLLPGHQRIFSLTLNFLFPTLTSEYYYLIANSIQMQQLFAKSFTCSGATSLNWKTITMYSTNKPVRWFYSVHKLKDLVWTGISELNPGTSWQSAWSKASPTPAPGGSYSTSRSTFLYITALCFFPFYNTCGKERNLLFTSLFVSGLGSDLNPYLDWGSVFESGFKSGSETFLLGSESRIRIQPKVIHILRQG